MDEQRASQCPDGTYEMKAAQDFKYKSLAKELHVGEVYLRVYNEQPDYELSQPDFFCESLLKFICKLVEERKKLSIAKDTVVEVPNEPELCSESSIEVESEVESDKDSHGKIPRENLSPEEVFLRDLMIGLTALQVCFKKLMCLILIQLYFFALTSRYTCLVLQNLLTSIPTLASTFSSKEQLIPLFECLVDTSSSGEVPELCLNILSILTTHAPSVEAMVADRSSLMHVLKLLHSTPSCRPGALRVLSALASTSELAWVTAKHGGFIYILQLLLPMQSIFHSSPSFISLLCKL